MVGTASGVVLDFDPATLLRATALVPLALLLVVILTPLVPKKLHLKTFASPGLHPVTSDEVRIRTRTWKHAVLSTVAGAEAAVWLASAIYVAVKKQEGWGDFLARVGIVWGWLYATVFPLVEPPCTAPIHLFNFYVLHFIAVLLNILSISVHPPKHDLPLAVSWIAFHVLALLAVLSVVLTMPLSPPSEAVITPEVLPEPVPEEGAPKEKGSDKIVMPSPEQFVTLLSWISFSWVSPLIKAGGKGRLGYADIWKLSDVMSSEGIRSAALEIKSTRLIPRIWYNNSLDIVLSLTLGLISTVLAYCSPYFLKQILTSLTKPATGEDSDPALRQSAYIYATLAFLAQIVRAEVDLQQLWHERRLIVRCRSQLMGEVYEKALKRREMNAPVKEEDLSKKEEGKDKKAKEGDSNSTAGSTGKIVQLMASDTRIISSQLMQMSSTVLAPFELIIAITFLYQLMGWSCIAGLSCVAIALPINNILVRRRIRLQRFILSSRDKRMDVLNEFIQAIRFVKYSASEKNWLERVFSARQTELEWLMKTRMNNLGINIVWNFSPDMVMLTSIAFYTLVMKQDFTVPVAFTSMALFMLLRSPMNTLPMSITQVLQTYVSVQRLEAFFDEPEVEPWVSALRPDSETHANASKVAIVNGSFKYPDGQAKPVASKIVPVAATVSVSAVESSDETPLVTETEAELLGGEDEEEEPFELKDIDVEFPAGKLSLICGPTGSGKTSIFQALLGEMNRTEGIVSLPKETTPIDAETGLYNGTAYTSQLPWLEHASIKNNILFGSPWDEQRYQDVLEACALGPDIAMFDARDEAEIGEKGLTLSGGQKARVALARACYSRARVVLLDDPLSAVDMHTARHLFKKCLKGPLMSSRTIILITHHISLCLSGADLVVRMHSGRIALQGPVSELDKSQLTSDLAEEVADDPKAVAAIATVGTPVEGATPADTRAPTPASEGPESTRAKSDGVLVEEEKRQVGQVKWKVYKAYLSAAGWWMWALIFALSLSGRWFRVLDRYWFKIWGESYRSEQFSFSGLLFVQARVGIPTSALLAQNATLASVTPQLPSASDNVWPYLCVYFAICVINILILSFTILAGFQAALQASKILFTETLTRVVRAPFRYYDTTPTGRILNRFSTDFQTIDTSLTDQVRMCMTQAFQFIVNVGVIIVVSPSFIPVAFVICFFYVQLSLSYVRCSRDLRRLESNARSPIYSKFGETLTGIVTCRAFSAERRFLQNLFSSVDTMLAAHYASAMVNRYLLWRFDCLGAIAIAVTTFLTLGARVSPGMAALAITSAQTLVQSIYWLCRFISALEVDLNAVERITELLETPQEPLADIESTRPPAYWPSDKGGIVVEDLVMTYAPTLPPVIKGVTFEIQPREKVAIVGRTGSGKTSLAMALLRINEATSGRILIDGVDIHKIGLSSLRSRITLIPQEAVLFSGTVRSNLDPFDEHSDLECLDALGRTQMIALGSARASRTHSREQSRSGSPTPGAKPNLKGGLLAVTAVDTASDTGSESETTRVDQVQGRQGVHLSTAVSAGGSNFSAGQRQLLAMARALLRRSKVIIMDEATASVDFETDVKIQHTIREEFADSLVLTIAHRLRTVIDNDKILVLNAGRVEEFDSPRNLLLRENGAFRKMCESATDWDELKRVAGV